MFAFSVIHHNTKHIESIPQTKFETVIINMRNTLMCLPLAGTLLSTITRHIIIITC